MPSLPPAGQSQDQGRQPSSRPRCSIRTHQPASRHPPSRWPAGNLGRYQEEGKELIGAYKNAGSDYRPQGCPDEVNVHDFADKELGKGIPYGVYDIAADVGCVSVGIDHDTAEFAVNAIGRWHQTMGCERYPTA